MTWLLVLLPLFCGVVFSSQDNVSRPSTICPPGTHFVRAHDRSDYYRSDGTYVFAAHVTAHCAGNPDGYDFSKSKLNNNRPDNWPNEDEKNKTWTTFEEERVIEELGRLPKGLLNFKNIYRMGTSIFPGNPASIRNGDIVLYDQAFSKKKQSVTNSGARIVTSIL